MSDIEPTIAIQLTAAELIAVHEYLYAALCYKGDDGNNALNNGYEKIMNAREIPLSEYKISSQEDNNTLPKNQGDKT